jgi:hypothetical protein
LQIILELCLCVFGILGISSKSLIPPPISSLSPTPYRNNPKNNTAALAFEKQATIGNDHNYLPSPYKFILKRLPYLSNFFSKILPSNYLTIFNNYLTKGIINPPTLSPIFVG